MPNSMPAVDALNREFLEIRAELLRIAASLDRIGRGDGDVTTDPRTVQLHQALEILQRDQPNRVEQLLMLFSLEYDPNWRDNFGITASERD